MRKWVVLFIVFAMAVFAAACGGSGGSKNDGKSGASSSNAGQSAGGSGETAGKGSGKPVTLKILNGKVEISEKMNELKAEYEASHPGVKLQIESVMTSEVSATLKAKYAGKERPDIFLNGGDRDLDNWIDQLEDLSDQPWVDDLLDMVKPPISKDGKIYGLPVNIEGFGLAYNKALFEKAGIEKLPKTLGELRDVMAQLKANGIEPFAFALQSWYSPGEHWLSVAVAQQPDPDAFIQGLFDGTEKIPGNPVFEQWVDMLDVVLEYSHGNPLTTDYNGEVTLFANGEVAMIKAGNWTQVLVDSVDPDLEVGMLPIPINDDPDYSDKVFGGVPRYWVVNKHSENKELAKEFLNWLATSETGKRYMTDEFQFIAGFGSMTASPEALGGLGTDLQRYLQEDRLLRWRTMKYPEGVTQDWGSSVQEYAAGRINREQLLQAFQDSWDKISGKK